MLGLDAKPRGSGLRPMNLMHCITGKEADFLSSFMDKGLGALFSTPFETSCRREVLKMAGWANTRRALALTCVCALVVTVAAETVLKDDTKIRLSNAEVEGKLQVQPNFHIFSASMRLSWIVIYLR
jgi:hypothetical protein